MQTDKLEHLNYPAWRATTIYPQRQEQIPPCNANCPSGVDTRGWIGLIAQRDKLGLTLEDAMLKAWHKLVAFNPLPAVLGRICPHTCESQCNRTDKEGAISIHALERSIGDWALSRQLNLPVLDTSPKTESVGVVGAGPAGLSFAYQLARRGYSVTIYDQHAAAGGMLRYGIPNYRLPRNILDREIERIRQLGVVFHFNTNIGKEVTATQLRKQHHELFIGIGAHRAITLGIPGENGPQVMAGAQFMYLANQGQINQDQGIALGTQVVVVGGGNTAIDAARVVRRFGVSVTVIYRRTEREMPAIREEVVDAKAEGVEFHFLATPKAILRDQDRLIAVQVQRMQLVDIEPGCRQGVVPIPGDIYTINADLVVAAVSQQPDWRSFTDIYSHVDHPITDHYGEISSGLWSGGDSIHLGTVTQAIGSGRLAAEAMHAKLCGLPLPVIKQQKPICIDRLHLDHYRTQERIIEDRRSAAERLANPDNEVCYDLTEAQFLTEASRCLSCGNCYGCEYCWMYCNGTAYSHIAQPSPGGYFDFNPSICQGCGKCIDLCPTGYLGT